MSKQIKKNIQEMILPKPELMSYYVNISTEKTRDRFIKRIESIVRNSLEYKGYIEFLKKNVNMEKCAFFQKVCQGEENTGRKRISIEIHHEPFTLYDYCDIILDKWEYEGNTINDLLIADEVLKLHYENKVGLVPLSKTIHQAVHSSELNHTYKVFVPIYMVYGNYKEFIEENEASDKMERLFKKLERKIELAKNVTEDTFDAIRKNFTYLHVDGYQEVEKMEIPENRKAM